MKIYLRLLLAISLLSTSLSAQQTVGLFLNDSLAYNGYTLFAPSAYTTTYLIDNCGKVVNSWDSNFPPGAAVYLLENGDLLRCCRISSSFNGGGTGGRFERYNWEGDLVWSYEYSSPQYHHHHDVEVMPNGNILLIAWEYRSETESINAGRNPNTVTSNGMWSEQIVELEPIGSNEANVVWIWHLWDHMVQDFDPDLPNYGVVADHPELMNINYVTVGGNNQDWIHLNSIDYNPELDQVIVSSRHLSEIWIIDHSTTTQEAASHTGGNSGKGGDILYRWGNPEVYDRGTSDDQTLYVQHDAHWIESGLPDAGKIMVFNNGANRPGPDFSSVDVLTPPMDLDGNYLIEDVMPFGPTSLDWTYIAPEPTDFFSQNISGAGRLPNGNTLICDGRDGRFFEVDLDGTILWDYISPVRNNGPVSQGSAIMNNDVFRAYRYGPDYPGLVDKELLPGDPVELDPLPSDCTIYGVMTSSVEVQEEADIRVLNNPVAHELLLENPFNYAFRLEVFDVSGRLVYSGRFTEQHVSVNSYIWRPGMYVLRLQVEGRALSSHFKILKI